MIHTLRLRHLSLPLALGAPIAAQGLDPASTEFARAGRRARALLEAHADVMDVPGLSAAVGLGDRVVWSEALGWADLEQRVPVTPLTRFRIGSVSKTFTAAVLARLVEDGALDLDDPIGEHVPGWVEGAGEMTLRHLAQHRAGIRHYRTDDELWQTRHFPTAAEALALFSDDPLLFRPGSQYSYSTYGYTLLSAALEATSGETFATLLHEEVVAPLGLASTGVDDVTRLVPGRCRGYVLTPDDTRRPAPLGDNSYKWAGGGMLSSPEDMVRFGLAHLEAGYLARESLAALFDVHTEIEGEGGVGVSWERRTSDSGLSTWMFSGNLPDGRALLAIYPDQRLAVAFAANTGTSVFFNDNELFAFAELFLAASPFQAGVAIAPPHHVYSLAVDGRRGPESWELRLWGEPESLHGTLTLGVRPFPVPVARFDGKTLRAFAVPGNWIELELELEGESAGGTWRRGRRKGTVRGVTPL